MDNHCNLAIETGVENNCIAIQTGNIPENGSRIISHKNRANSFTRGILSLLFFIIMVIWTISSTYAQSFDCKKDRLHAGAIQFSQDPTNLILGQSCQISIFKSNGKKIDKIKNFALTSDNDNVKSSGLNFFVENNAKREPWLYVGGRLIEERGNITISINNCNQTYTFPFEIRQSYVFDREISCKGDKREFAIAPYKNSMNQNLYVVLDISTHQLYLLEAPISIDASGFNGMQGIDGRPGIAGKEGAKGTEKRPDGGSGTDGSNGSDGGDGGDGGNGGEITVYMSKNIPNVVSVNVEGGEGGRGGAGGAGGRGGSGGSPYRIKVGTKKVLGGISIPIYEDRGRKGNDGRDGMTGKPGRGGQQGRRGNYAFSVVDDLNKYFENIQHPHFNLENILQ